ncbi:Acyltransferase family protein [Gemmata obscuriglobus]|uniref:Acyltransferase n=1 Tax=Gemmata obscuriglobus TaxID=114 RepID=A0A2Z3H2P4_9BACT|nr:acyltransferase [Gemmata obscuriglobus]QEG26497.1 Acyltransferase family protein [Gemmata obscuriglobus]VTS01779.1 integral membrane protein : Acyltransferase 3 OS=Novosphingobium nitrogenifigens DSM 19370 GN=Y88_0771 PE=4 SV=1: Acyl_transf_3 [Gemmata obscuriglobus UQM 2246]
MQKNRDGRSDELKAVAIVAVVCIHAGLPYADILRFCVPVFLSIWAYHYEQGLSRRQDRTWTYAQQRFVRLLIPYLFWTAVYIPLFHTSSEWRSVPPNVIVNGWLGGYGWSGQYFFIILFQLTLLFPLLRRYASPLPLWIVIAVGAICNPLADYYLFRSYVASGVGDRLFVYWLPYVFVGIGLARGTIRPTLLLMPLATATLLTPTEFSQLLLTVPRASPYLVVSVTVGSLAILLAMGPTTREPSLRQLRWRQVIQYIGRNSFSIFLSHLLFLNLGGVLFDMSNVSIRVLITGIAIIGGLGLGVALKRIRLGILVGQ